jgi:DNA-binding transcriptional LysR family regulator
MEQISIDRLAGIVAFARAASLGSYTAAARALAVSPSAVSKSVQRLEERLGVRLFTRTTRSLTLTAEGRDLHERALRLLREAEGLEQVALAAQAEPAGIIRVTAAVPVGLHLIAPHLPAFRQRFPKVTIDLRLSDTMTDLVEAGIDVAIRVGPLADTRFIARRLSPSKACTVAAPSYLKQRGVPHHPDDLRGHECVNVRFKSSGQTLRWHFKIEGRVVEFEPQAAITVDNSDAVLAAVVAGGGVGVSPAFVAAPLVRAGLVVPVLREFMAETKDIVALWPESRRSNPTVRAFVQFMAEVCPDPAPWNDTVFSD